MNFLKKTMAAAAISVLSLGATSQAALPQSLLDGAFPNSEVVVLLDYTTSENPQSFLSLYPLKEMMLDSLEAAENRADSSDPYVQKATASMQAAKEAGIFEKIKATSISVTNLENFAAGSSPTMRLIVSGDFTTADFTTTYSAMGIMLPEAGTVVELPKPSDTEHPIFINHPADGFLIFGTTEASAATKVDGTANKVLAHALPILSTESEFIVAFQMDQLRAQVQQMGPMGQMAAPILKASAASISTLPGDPPSMNLLLQYDDAQDLSIAKQFADMMIQGQLGALKQQREVLAQQGVTSSPAHEQVALMENIEIKEVGQNLHVRIPVPITDEMREQIRQSMMMGFQQGRMMQ